MLQARYRLNNDDMLVLAKLKQELTPPPQYGIICDVHFFPLSESEKLRIEADKLDERDALHREFFKLLERIEMDGFVTLEE